MEIKTEESLKNAFKIAAQTERFLLKDGTFPPFVLQEDIETMRFVMDTFLPKIKDLRTRRLIWLRSQGICWKTIEKEIGLAESHAKRVFSQTLKDIL